MGHEPFQPTKCRSCRRTFPSQTSQPTGLSFHSFLKPHWVAEQLARFDGK